MAGDLYAVIKTTANLIQDTENPDQTGPRDSQLLFGEDFEVQKRKGEWLYGVSVTDDYTGYIHESDLRPKEENPTHIVDVPLTHIYPTPDFKTPPVMALSFLSRLSVETQNTENGFVEIPGFGWVFADHLTDFKNPAPEKDLVDTALMFLNTPYLYGGRSGLGLDCSALVQLSLLRHGMGCPRDSDQQISIGNNISKNEIKRGDLVFFDGHVGIAIDQDYLLNASARTMGTYVESLTDVIKVYDKITAIKRLELPNLQPKITGRETGEPDPSPADPH